MERRKYESRNELEMRREDRRRRGKKRSATPEDTSNKKSRTQQSPNTKYEEVVTLLSESDVEDRKSVSPNSEPEEGTNITLIIIMVFLLIIKAYTYHCIIFLFR